jgi:hypothetical protein
MHLLAGVGCWSVSGFGLGRRGDPVIPNGRKMQGRSLMWRGRRRARLNPDSFDDRHLTLCAQRRRDCQSILEEALSERAIHVERGGARSHAFGLTAVWWWIWSSRTVLTHVKRRRFLGTRGVNPGIGVAYVFGVFAELWHRGEPRRFDALRRALDEKIVRQMTAVIAVTSDDNVPGPVKRAILLVRPSS